MEKIISTDCVKYEVLHTFKEEKNILHAIKRKRVNCIGHVLCRNCLLNYVT